MAPPIFETLQSVWRVQGLSEAMQTHRALIAMNMLRPSTCWRKAVRAGLELVATLQKSARTIVPCHARGLEQGTHERRIL